jgi:hypothetical protein
MIGHFEEEDDAIKAREIVETLTKQVAAEQTAGSLTLGSPTDRYSNDMLELLGKLNVTLIGPRELEQFAYEVKVELQGRDLVLSTEEYDVSAFLKVMFLGGARIEVYSAHNHPDTAHGRGR